MKKALLGIFALVIISAIFSILLYAENFKVIVHESNPISSLTRADVSKLFLKKATQLNGTTALPIDLVSSNPVRQSFSRYIHRRPVSAIKAYWQQQIFSGRGVPPPAGLPTQPLLPFAGCLSARLESIHGLLRPGRSPICPGGGSSAGEEVRCLPRHVRIRPAFHRPQDFRRADLLCRSGPAR